MSNNNRSNERINNFCFTLYGDTPVEFNDKFRYLIFQRECCPSSGRLHYQGYAELAKETRFNTVKKFLPTGTHFEKRRGTQLQAIEYCKKSETAIPDSRCEFGTPKEPGKRNDIVSFRDAIKEGSSDSELIEDMPVLVAKYPKFISDVKRAYSEPRNWITEVIVLYGPSGCGKTKYVYDNETDFDSITYRNNFIIDYTGKPVVLIDNFEPKNIDRRTLLRLLDRYPLTVNIKYGEMNWNPKKIYITTNFDPNTWYVQSEAIMRRVTKFINFYDADK